MWHQWFEPFSESYELLDLFAGVRLEPIGLPLPGETLPTWLLALRHPRLERWAAALRAHTPAVVGRIEEERLLLDPRTVLPDQEAALLEAIHHCSPDIP